MQFRDERRYLNGSVQGSYGYLRPDALIQVTRYSADKEGGYSAHTQSYAPGDPLQDAAWPTPLPQLLINPNQLPPAVNVTWDAKSHLNLSVDELEDALVEELKTKHGLDLFHIDVEHDLQPELLDIVNGKTPLREQPNGSLAFEKLQHAIPDVLPLVPFQLPAEQLLTTEATQAATDTTATTTREGATTEEGGATIANKYNKAKSNNDAKAPQVAAPVTTTAGTLPPPRPLVNPSGNSNSSDWYQQIIQANRREFLEHLPNLHTKRQNV